MRFFKRIAAPLAMILSITPTFAQSHGPNFEDEAFLEERVHVFSEDFKEIIRELDPNGFKYSVKSLEVNTKYSEHGTAFFMNKLVYVSSKKIGAFFAKKDEKTNEAFEDLYCAEIDFHGEAQRTQAFSRILNDIETHEGDATFNKDQTVIYFTKSDTEDDHNLKLYRAELKNYKWINIELLPFNAAGYTIENPFLTRDEKTLYFSSNIPGTRGGFDIFKVNINNDGSYSEPINLGKNINTNKNEYHPYLLPDNSALYFSSDGHYNMGGLDIFESKITGSTYNFPVNMGSSINSVADDFAFMMDLTNTGFFTSNREGGKGGNDIYHFKREKIEQKMVATVVEKESQLALPNAEVIVKDAYDRVMYTLTTNEAGQIELPITPYNIYSFETTKDGYEDETTFFESDRGEVYTFDEKIELIQKEAEIVKNGDKLMIDIEKIYFDFDKWNLRAESKLALNKVVQKLEEYPLMNIEINAHTDDRGSNAYNQSLSERRAASTMKYLLSKGVSKDRIVSHGFGESQPIESCSKGCSEDQHQLNRRVEFIILNM